MTGDWSGLLPNAHAHVAAIRLLTTFLRGVRWFCRPLEVLNGAMEPVSYSTQGATMLRLLIPILCRAGATEAARHAAFLFAEKCVSHVELIEVLEESGEGRAAAFHSRSALRLREKAGMRDALLKTGAILDEAGVPYTWKRVFGTPMKTVATHAAACGCDLVVLDAGGLGFVRRWLALAGLLRRSRVPIMVVH
jgi:nucleotide-binding universal stress UspA family protein